MENEMPEESKIELQVAMVTPQIPNFIKLKSLRASSQDQAYSSGEHYSLDVADLDDKAIERVIKQWSAAFRLNCQERRVKPK